MIIAVAYLFLLSMSNVIIPLFALEASTGKKTSLKKYHFMLLLIVSMACIYYLKLHYFLIELIIYACLIFKFRKYEEISIPYCLGFFVIINMILMPIINVLYFFFFVGYSDLNVNEAFSGIFSNSDTELIVKMLYFIILLYIQGFGIKESNVLEKKYWSILHVFTSLIITLLIIFMVFIQNIDNLEYIFILTFITLLILTLLILFNIFFIWFHNNMLDNHNLIMEREQNQFKLDALLEGQKHMEALKKFKHDIQNNFIIINHMLIEKQYEAAMGYLDEYTKKFSELNKFIQIDNLIISAIINDKMKRYPLISFDVRCFVPESLSMDQLDLGNILGNLVDNACEHMNLHNLNGILSIKILTYYDMDLFIEITNPCINESITENTFLTNKTEKEYHGYGLKNIEKAIQKYDGMFIKKIENECFIAQILIPGGAKNA